MDAAEQASGAASSSEAWIQKPNSELEALEIKYIADAQQLKEELADLEQEQLAYAGVSPRSSRLAAPGLAAAVSPAASVGQRPAQVQRDLPAWFRRHLGMAPQATESEPEQSSRRISGVSPRSSRFHAVTTEKPRPYVDPIEKPSRTPAIPSRTRA